MFSICSLCYYALYISIHSLTLVSCFSIALVPRQLNSFILHNYLFHFLSIFFIDHLRENDALNLQNLIAFRVNWNYSLFYHWRWLIAPFFLLKLSVLITRSFALWSFFFAPRLALVTIEYVSKSYSLVISLVCARHCYLTL